MVQSPSQMGRTIIAVTTERCQFDTLLRWLKATQHLVPPNARRSCRDATYRQCKDSPRKGIYCTEVLRVWSGCIYQDFLNSFMFDWRFGNLRWWGSKFSLLRAPGVWPVARFQGLGFSGGQQFCYFRFETNFPGHNKIWGTLPRARLALQRIKSIGTKISSVKHVVMKRKDGVV